MAGLLLNSSSVLRLNFCAKLKIYVYLPTIGIAHPNTKLQKVIKINKKNICKSHQHFLTLVHHSYCIKKSSQDLFNETVYNRLYTSKNEIIDI